MTQPQEPEFAEGERPEDYEPCGACGYDHAYEPEESAFCPGLIFDYGVTL